MSENPEGEDDDNKPNIPNPTPNSRIPVLHLIVPLETALEGISLTSHYAWEKPLLQQVQCSSVLFFLSMYLRPMSTSNKAVMPVLASNSASCNGFGFHAHMEMLCASSLCLPILSHYYLLPSEGWSSTTVLLPIPVHHGDFTRGSLPLSTQVRSGKVWSELLHFLCCIYCQYLQSMALTNIGVVGRPASLKELNARRYNICEKLIKENRCLCLNLDLCNKLFEEEVCRISSASTFFMSC